MNQNGQMKSEVGFYGKSSVFKNWKQNTDT